MEEPKTKVEMPERKKKPSRIYTQLSEAGKTAWCGKWKRNETQVEIMGQQKFRDRMPMAVLR